MRLSLTSEQLENRRKAMDAKGSRAWKPATRQRVVSQALKAYAAMATSAARGAVRDVSQVERKALELV